MNNTLCLEEILWVKKGQGIAARGVIPHEAEFFKDHFPGFPILPGVLALEMLKQTAEQYFRVTLQDESLVYAIKKITAVKFSKYLKPGDAWESSLRLETEDEHGAKWIAQLMHQGQVAVSAKLILESVKVQPILV